MKRTKRIFIALLLATTGPLAVSAQVGVAPQQRLPQAAAMPAFTHPQSVPQDLALVDRAMNATGSFQGRFTQYGSDGSVSSGSIYIQRPGRFRFEYDPPNPLLIVSNGTTYAIEDNALQTFDRFPLETMPLYYFLKENVRLQDDTEVIALQKLPNEWRVTLKDGSGRMPGSMTLVFDSQTMAMKEWVITDEFGGDTRTVLSNLRYNDRINPRLFILRDERENRKARNQR